MRSIFAFFGLVAILLLCSDSSAQFPPQGGGQGGAGGFGGGKKNKGGGADGGFGGGFQGGGGFGKGNKGGGGFPGQGGFGGGQGGFGGGQGGAQGGFGQGGFPGGGQGGFGQGGFGKGGGGKKNAMDPNQLFDMLARNRAYFTIAEAPQNLQMPLRAFAKDKQLTSDQITRDQFLFFYPSQNEYRALAGAVMRNQGGGMDGQGPKGGGRGGPEAIANWAEADFRKRDLNQDDMLNFDEMPEALRDEVASGRWDSNRDGLIGLDEYKAYFLSRAQQMNDGNSNMNSNGPVTILIEEDYDRRPDVIRAGKLPTNLPKWFTEIDTDQDGQIQLHEWYAYGKDPEEFKTWDRDDDKLLTAQEVLFKMKVQPIFLATNGNRGPGGGFNNANGDYGPGDNGFGNGFGGGNGGPGGGKKGKGNNGGFGGDFGGGDNGFGNNGFGGGNGGPGGGKKGKGNNGGGFGGFNGAGAGGADMQDLILQFRAAGKGKGFGGGGDTGGDTGFGGGKGKGKGKKGGGGG